MLNWAAVLIALVLVLAGFAAWRVGRIWWKWHGRRAITCPDSHEPAGVSLDVRHAAATALKGDPELRLARCSRWPEKFDCGQDCLFQIERTPEDCLVRNILIHWYEGKNCVWCGRPIGEIHVGER